MYALLGALVFGSLVYLAIAFTERVMPPGDRSGTVGSEVLRIALCALAAIAGGILISHSAAPETLVAIAVLSAALGATCFLTTLDSGAPAILVGASLAVLVGPGILQGDFGPFFSALVTGAPFAATVLFARKAGADWRDALVAALGGAAFGMQIGMFVVGVACLLIAMARPYLARHRTRPQPPVRFSSTLAATFMIVLVGQLAIAS